MRGLHYNLKQRLKHGYTKLHELKPNSREVAKRLLELGEIGLMKTVSYGWRWSD